MDFEADAVIVTPVAQPELIAIEVPRPERVEKLGSVKTAGFLEVDGHRRPKVNDQFTRSPRNLLFIDAARIIRSYESKLPLSYDHAFHASR